MNQMLYFRESLINLIKKHEKISFILLKFFSALFIYSFILSIGNYSDELSFIFADSNKFIYMFLMIILFVILPLNLNYLFLILNIGIQFSFNTNIALVTIAVFLLGYLFYAHIDTNETIFIIITMLSIYFKIPYFVPIVAGIYFSITSVIPIILGCFFYSYMNFLINYINNIDVYKITIDNFSNAYSVLVKNPEVINNTIQLSAILVIVLIFTNIVSKISINYNKIISVFFSTVLNIILFIMFNVIFNTGVNIFTIIIMNIISFLICLIILFFDNILDYDKLYNLSFEDEDNIYYVKVIPKVKYKKVDKNKK